MEYVVILKSGVTLVVTKDDDRSPVALWKWSMKQSLPQILSFGTTSVLSTDIAAVIPKEEWQ